MQNKKKQEALRLLEILEKATYQARLVGGCVRDELLGLSPKDYDVACSATPEQIVDLFKQKRIRHLTYGKEHGTITALMPSGPVEVTTLREDVKTHGRRAEVAFHSDFETDACRRDFTINAMSEDRQGTIFDYFEGRKHLEQRRLCFVGDPVVRIREDYLRIMRFFRFKARFALKSDAKTLKAMAGEVQGLQQVSQERVTSEMLGILQCKDIKNTLGEMSETGVLGFVFKDYAGLIEKQRLEVFRCIEELEGVSQELKAQVRIAVFLWFMRKEETAWKQYAELQDSHLRLSNKERFLIVHLLEAAEIFPQVKKSRVDVLLFIDRFDGKEGALFLNCVVPFLKAIYKSSDVHIKNLKSMIEMETKFGERRKPLAIQGIQVMKELGISSGPLVGEVLHTLRCAYLNGEWDTEEEAFAWLRKHVLL
jgi:tRNA nucleotidyltransferase/poly(A) polymerase